MVQEHTHARQHEHGNGVGDDEGHEHGIGSQVGGAADANRVWRGACTLATTSWDHHRLGDDLVGEQEGRADGCRGQPGEQGQRDVQVATLTQLSQAGMLYRGITVQGEHEERDGAGSHGHDLVGGG